MIQAQYFLMGTGSSAGKHATRDIKNKKSKRVTFKNLVQTPEPK